MISEDPLVIQRLPIEKLLERMTVLATVITNARKAMEDLNRAYEDLRAKGAVAQVKLTEFEREWSRLLVEFKRREDLTDTGNAVKKYALVPWRQ